MNLDELYDESLNPKKKDIDNDFDDWESPKIKPHTKHINVL